MSKKTDSFAELVKAFSEATNIVFSLVFFPIVLLILGVFLDKNFNTKPLFIILGIVGGVFFAIYQGIKTERRLRSKK